MEHEIKAKLEAFALKELWASRDDEEQWSFLFRTDGAVGLLCCPWTTTEDWEFDGEIKNLSLTWSQERLEQLRVDPFAELTDDELAEWRRAKCHQLAAGSDWCVQAWIVPLKAEDSAEGWGLFLCQSDDEDSAPDLEGVFDDLEDAKNALARIAAVAVADGQ